MLYKSWAKRGNFNKAQILYYFGENFTARKDDLVKKLEKVTVKSTQECLTEIQLCSDVIFHFAATCDKRTGKLNVIKYKVFRKIDFLSLFKNLKK